MAKPSLRKASVLRNIPLQHCTTELSTSALLQLQQFWKDGTTQKAGPSTAAPLAAKNQGNCLRSSSSTSCRWVEHTRLLPYLLPGRLLFANRIDSQNLLLRPLLPNHLQPSLSLRLYLPNSTYISRKCSILQPRPAWVWPARSSTQPTNQQELASAQLDYTFQRHAAVTGHGTVSGRRQDTVLAICCALGPAEKEHCFIRQMTMYGKR